jgi:hypothetical protein
VDNNVKRASTSVRKVFLIPIGSNKIILNPNPWIEADQYEDIPYDLMVLQLPIPPFIKTKCTENELLRLSTLAM